VPATTQAVRPPHPSCPTLLVCADATTDPARGRVNITGAFDSLVAASLPDTVEVMVVFTLTDGLGDYAVELTLEHRGTLAPLDPPAATLGRSIKRITLTSPDLFQHELVPLRIKVVHEGAYTLRVRANGEEVGRRTFWIRVREPGK
jgi:hypothetical protein